MKKFVYILLAVSAMLFVSCAKEIENSEVKTEKPGLTGSTITFNASIKINDGTKAELDGLNINWAEGDYVGIATDNDATIVAYPVSVDPSDATKGTITVNAVEGASAYYAIFKGTLDASSEDDRVAADDFSDITFNTSTKTFTGMSIGQLVHDGSIVSEQWHDKGYPLSMAGRSEGLSLEMKPCLALIKLQIAAESVPADKYIVNETYNNPDYGVDHQFSYSAVRGFDFYQRNGSDNLSTTGNYSVAISDSNDLTVTATGSNAAVREKSINTKLTADLPYYMCIIPGGEVTSFRLNFLGFTNAEGDIAWDAKYTMDLTKDLTVDAGDFFNLGTLNPLGRKKAKNHAEADAADELAAAQAVTIDGSFTDWDEVDDAFSPDGSGIVQWKYAYDEYNIYFFYKVTKSSITFSSDYGWNAYIPVAFNTDNVAVTGDDVSWGMGSGYEAMAIIYPWRGTTEGSPEKFVNTDGNGYVECPVGTSKGHIVSVGSDSDNDYSYVEVSISRTALGSPSGNITVRHGLNWTPVAAQQINLGGATKAVIIASDQSVDVGQSVNIGATITSGATISYVSNDESIATVSDSGVITGVAEGTAEITMSAPAVGETYTSATKTISVTVYPSFTPAITIDGNLSDWNDVDAFTGGGNGDRIKEWKFKSDERYVYVYLSLRKNRTRYDKYLYVGFDTDGDASTGEKQYDMTLLSDAYARLIPFTNSSNETTPIPVHGYDSSSQIKSTTGSTTNGKVYVWDYDEGEASQPISSSSSVIYVELSIPRDLIGLPATGTINVQCCYESGYFSGIKSVTL